MPANPLPSGMNDLFSLAERILAGLKLHGPWLQIEFERVLAEMLREARAAEADGAAARARKLAGGRRFAAAQAAFSAWLGKARLAVMLALGDAWSHEWREAGFAHGGTDVPERLAQRMQAGHGLTVFFTRHREFEVPFAGVTVAMARAVYAEIVGAELESRAARANAKRCGLARDGAERRLRRQMECVVALLPMALWEEDLRWKDFGLNPPGPGTPAGGRRRGNRIGAEVIPMPHAARLRAVASA